MRVWEKDRDDFLTHPEWFEVMVFQPDPAIRRELIEKAREVGMEQQVIDSIINPPITIRRKPIPFVLPIRGSAL